MAVHSKSRKRGGGKPFTGKDDPRRYSIPPGTTPNPGGLPAWAREIRSLAGSHAPEAIAKLVEHMRNGDGHVSRLAAEAILDRAGLKPYCLEPEKLDVTTHDDLDAATRLAALVARRAAAAGAHGGAGKPDPK